MEKAERISRDRSSRRRSYMTYHALSMHVGCGAGKYLCHNGRCISAFQLCDGHDDCGDNTDETLVCCKFPKMCKYVKLLPADRGNIEIMFRPKFTCSPVTAGHGSLGRSPELLCIQTGCSDAFNTFSLE